MPEESLHPQVSQGKKVADVLLGLLSKYLLHKFLKALFNLDSIKIPQLSYSSGKLHFLCFAM